MKEWLTFVTEYAIVVIDTLALVIIVVGTIEAFIAGLRLMLSSWSGHEQLGRDTPSLGSNLARSRSANGRNRRI